MSPRSQASHALRTTSTLSADSATPAWDRLSALSPRLSVSTFCLEIPDHLAGSASRPLDVLDCAWARVGGLRRVVGVMYAGLVVEFEGPQDSVEQRRLGVLAARLAHQET